MVRLRRSAITVCAFAGMLACTSALAQQENAADPARDLVVKAATALGGVERIQQLRSLKMIGYGEMLDGFGLSNITPSPHSPQKDVTLLEFERTFDLVNERMRTRQRKRTAFTFAAAGQNLGLSRDNEVLDGTIAYDVAEDGSARRVTGEDAIERRMRMLSHPVTAIRAALDSGARLGNLRREGNLAIMGLTTAKRDELTLAIDPETNLPAWVEWLTPNANFGEVTYRVHFDAYLPVDGVMLPMGYTTVQDFRGLVQEKLYIDRNLVNPKFEDMRAPANLTTRVRPEPKPTQIARGIWRFSHGTVAFEFADHITLFEVHGSEAAALSAIRQARQLVPGKPVTEVIVSHHHDDHTSGLRAAVAEGLTIITHRGNAKHFADITQRRTTRYHDAQGRNPQPLKLIAVDDHLKLKDSAMEVDIYHVIANNHMANGVMAYVPEHRMLVEADLTTQDWDYQWWGGSYLDNIEHRGIKVEINVPVHGTVEPIANVLAAIERQVEGARRLCARAAEAILYLPGCPVQYTRDGRE